MGVLRYEFYSKLLGKQIRLCMVLPEQAHAGKLPDATLYLLHGGGGNAEDWLRYTSVERYADERQMAVIMPEVDGTCFYADMKYGYPYFTYLTKEIPALVEALFPVNKERGRRFVAGLSMGGYGAWKWAFAAPQFFGAAANLSGISFVTEVFKKGGFAFADDENGNNPLVIRNWGSLDALAGSVSDSKTWVDQAVREKTDLPALYSGIGTEDFSFADSVRYLAYCRKQGLEIHSLEIPGKHEWKVWDTLISDFMDWAMLHADR